jgi:hypothetical protein
MLSLFILPRRSSDVPPGDGFLGSPSYRLTLDQTGEPDRLLLEPILHTAFLTSTDFPNRTGDAVVSPSYLKVDNSDEARLV